MKTIGITGGIGSGKSYVSALLREHFGIPVYDCDAEAKRLTASDAEIRQQLIQLVGPEVFDGTALNKQCLADFLFASAENARLVNAIIHPVVLKDFERWKEQTPPNPSGLRRLRSPIAPLPTGNCPVRGGLTLPSPDLVLPLTGATGAFRGATECGSGSTKGSEFPFATEGREGVCVCLESAILFESGFNKMVDYVLFVDAPEEVRLCRAMQRDGATEQQIRARMQMQHPKQYRSQSDFIIDNNNLADKELIEQLESALIFLATQ